jgi:hypothetical protein
MRGKSVAVECLSLCLRKNVGGTITKEAVVLDDFDDGRWDESFPGGVAGLDF